MTRKGKRNAEDVSLEPGQAHLFVCLLDVGGQWSGHCSDCLFVIRLLADLSARVQAQLAGMRWNQDGSEGESNSQGL